MTRKELLSKRKVKALRYLVDNGEYSAGYASDKLGDLFVEGIVLEADYEPLAEYLDELMDKEINAKKEEEEPEEEIVEPIAEESEGEVE